jgi:hypothetical protein
MKCLKSILEHSILETQNAFIRGCQIVGSILIANECIDSHLKSSKPGVLCKLDLKKAYDHASLDFLLYMVRKCGFRENDKVGLSTAFPRFGSLF